MRELPEEDQPSGAGLVPDDEATAIAAAGDLEDPRNPVAVAFAFVGAVLDEDGPDLESLRKLCTPESWGSWGDFSGVREEIGDRGVSTRVAAPADGDPNVRYAKLVHMNDPSNSAERVDGFFVADARIITLQWRPADGYWRVHAFGRYLRPEEMPRVQ